jgi:hypothetical protein
MSVYAAWKGGIMIPINIRDSRKLADAHAGHIIRYYQVYSRGVPLNQIETWIKTHLDKNLTFKKLLAADQETLAKIAAKYQRKRHKPEFGAGISGIKSQYERFRTVRTSPFSTETGTAYDGYVFAANLGLSVCPYCNRNYIFNIPETQRTTCELDHFYDKAAFPFLALSFYNLIPSCKTCNHLKSNAPGKFYNLHRSDRTETHLLRFSCKIKGAGFLDDTADLELKYEVDKLFERTFEQLRIKELYSKHLDLVQEVIKKRLIYNSGYIDQLYRDYSGTLFNSREQVLNHLLSSYIQEDEIHLRPFAKLIRHIWQQLEYLDY